MAKITNYLRNQFICDIIHICFGMAVLMVFVSMVACIIAVISETIKLLSHG